MDHPMPPGTPRPLRLFPLPGVVLMPGAAMPLHVFEPRYRQLVKDCLADDGLLAIPQIQPSEEERHLGAPPLYPYAGVGQIVAHQELPDGRFNIVVKPIGRVRLGLEQVTDTPYRVCEAELLPEISGSSVALGEIGRRTLAMFSPVLARVGEKGEAMLRMLRQLDAGRVPEAIAPWVLSDPEERQAYLAQDDAVRRAAMVETGVLALVATASTGEVGEA
jgi:uncharacterized protein